MLSYACLPDVTETKGSSPNYRYWILWKWCAGATILNFILHKIMFLWFLTGKETWNRCWCWESKIITQGGINQYCYRCSKLTSNFFFFQGLEFDVTVHRNLALQVLMSNILTLPRSSLLNFKHFLGKVNNEISFISEHRHSTEK